MADKDKDTRLSPLDDKDKWPGLAAYVSEVKEPSRDIIGRDKELMEVMASLNRPELSNVMLLAPPGSGKTALVQAASVKDPSRVYLEIDLSRMISGVPHPHELAARLKNLFDEVVRYHDEVGQELVLFIDEFHQIPQMSQAAVEAIKPILADSGTRGINLIAATTFEEYNEFVKSNKALDERLQRISITPTNGEMTVEILRGMAKTYGVDDQFYDDHIYELIFEWSQRYMESSTQPRKSIRLLDAMIGRHRFTGEKLDEKLLAEMLKQMTGINVAFVVDGDTIKQRLDEKVFSQDAATTALSRRLQLAVADLNDKSRPMLSALFTGPTGVGKLCVDTTPVPVYVEDGSISWKNHGDLREGDKVFTRDGSVQEVLGHYPQGVQDVYRVTLWDGRTLDVGGPHLWGVYTSKMRENKYAGKDVQPRVMTTLEMMEAGVVSTYPGSKRRHLKYFIPANGAVQWPEQELAVDPYMLGVFIGNGSLTQKPLTLSSDDAAVVSRVGESLGVIPKKKSDYDYSWLFPTGEKWGQSDKLVQTRDLFTDAEDVIGAYSGERRIPQKYLHGSIEQRWELVRGLFDTDGTIDASTGRFNISYSTMSKGLAEDVRQLLFSLGVSNTLNAWTRTRDGEIMVEYDVHVKIGNEDKEQFFWLPRKRQIAHAAAEATTGRQRVKKFDMVGITSIDKLELQESSSCIYVSGHEHLYQAGQFVVTHNTELSKQLSNILFDDDTNRLIRFDMSEFVREESLPTFTSELTQKVSNMGHAIILFDEVEKANPAITRLLLQVLDDGRMRDDYGREVSFLSCYIIMTTNAGSEVFKVIEQYASDDTGSSRAMADFEKVIRDSIKNVHSGFPPELLGRIDVIVPFQPLSRNTQRKIIKRKLRELHDTVYARHGVKLRIDDKVLDYIVEDRVETDTEAGGARGAVRVLVDEVSTEVAMFLNRYKGVRNVQVGVEGTMRFEDKTMLKSEASIVVGEAVMEDA